MAKLIKAVTSEGFVRAFAIEATDIVNAAQKIHNLSPTASAALGRTLIATSMIGSMQKDNSSVTVQIKGDGPIGTITCVTSESGNVKGYAQNPFVDIAAKPNGKLDVSGAVGSGVLTVIKDMKLKEPFVGQIELVSGEIAKDFTAYFAISEQTPSVCALGVLVDTDCSIKYAGGYIIQLMPFADSSVADVIENNINALESVTSLLSKMSIEQILNKALNGFEVEILESRDVKYCCDCSKERTARALCAISPDQLDDIIEKGEDTEIVCRFCNKKYIFPAEELKKLRT